MHRFALLLAIALFCTSGAVAQTIDRSDIESRVNVPIESRLWDAHDNAGGSPMPDTSGLSAILRGESWDFRPIVKDLRKNAVFTLVRMPADVPGADSFATATHVETVGFEGAGGNGDSTIHRFISLTDNALTVLGTSVVFDLDQNGEAETLVTRHRPDGWKEADLPAAAGKSWQNTFTQETWVNVPGFGSILITGTTERREYEVVRAGTMRTPSGSVPAIVVRVYEFITHEQAMVDIALERYSFIAANGTSVTVAFEIDKQTRERLSLNDIAYFVPEGSTSVRDVATEVAVRLDPNYPNPLSDRTAIPFALERPEHVRLSVSDAMGRDVAVVADRTFTAGEHEIEFRTDGLPDGMYNYRLQAGETILSGKMIVRR